MTETGLSVDILNDEDEKIYIYKEVNKLFGLTGEKIESGIMAFIGIGNLGVSYYQNGTFPFMHSVRLGSLRLSELFGRVLEYSENHYQIIDEYQSGVIDDVKILMPREKAKSFILCGSEVTFLADICEGVRHGSCMYITKDKFLSLFEIIKGKTYDQLMDDYSITEKRAELLFPFMSMCKTLLSQTDADKIITPLVYVRDAVMYELLFANKAREYDEKFDENIVIGALSMADRYQVDMAHAEVITNFSLAIFDKLKTRAGFSKRDRLMLRAAAIMHDIGKFINLKEHDDHAYSIITGSDISGLNPDDKELIACVNKFNGKMPDNSSVEYQRLPTKKRILVSKLSCILGLAETLDRSHTQKFKDISVTLKEHVLTISVATHQDILLEEWAFNRRVDTFEQVFGIKAVLRRKKVNL
jgi:exopolyphosphatase/guanosine-5'-triphosphate,3'-diphosphate pyrophosphatase